jgi:hypothetical protein
MPGELWDRLCAANGGMAPPRRQQLLALREDLRTRITSLESNQVGATRHAEVSGSLVADAATASRLVLSSTDPAVALALHVQDVARQTARGCRLAVRVLEVELAAVETLLSQENPR